MPHFLQQLKQRHVVPPFANLSGEQSRQYFSDGLTVIAWNTAARYRHNADTPTAIGKALNVASMVDGSIERAGDEVRVSAELVSTVTGRHRRITTPGSRTSSPCKTRSPDRSPAHSRCNSRSEKLAKRCTTIPRGPALASSAALP